MITRLRLQHFRSYTDSVFELAQGVTIVAGPNASGKTNLLEAVLVSALGGSFRARDAELVQFGSAWARIDAQTPLGSRVVKIQTEPSANKTFEIGDHQLTRLHQTRTLPAVLFEPNHLLLLHGSPDLRRSFLDDLIEQSESGFAATRRHYRRVLAQRNALLKQNPANLANQLFVWNVRLSELGGQIAKQRLALIGRLQAQVAELYSSLAGKPYDVVIEYVSKFSGEQYESALLNKLESNLMLDIARGFTASGPHRDDLIVLLNGHPAQETASRGEIRTLVLALKILELKEIEQARRIRPLLLLDDVFSELDAERRQALTRYAEQYQTIITTTDADSITDYFSKSRIITP